MSTPIPCLTVNYKGVVYHLNNLQFTYSPHFDVEWENIQDKDWNFLSADQDLALSRSSDFKIQVAKAIAQY